jgi:hypothetical protein
MKFKLLSDWPVTGQHIIPANTVIDESMQWNGIPIPWPLPLNAKALDQEALNALACWHGEELFHLLQYTPGLCLPNPHYPPPAPQRKE